MDDKILREDAFGALLLGLVPPFLEPFQEQRVGAFRGHYRWCIVSKRGNSDKSTRRNARPRDMVVSTVSFPFARHQPLNRWAPPAEL